VTPAQVRLAWTLHLGPHVLAIPGTGDPAHLTENVAAAALRLTPADMARLSTPYPPARGLPHLRAAPGSPCGH
jgi:pyridoxine 4-dehydrogenase